MKKNLFLGCVIFLSSLITHVHAQEKIKEGKIKFEMSYPDSGESAQLVRVMPKEMVVYFKNGDARSEMQISGHDMVMIRSAKSDFYYNLIEIHDNKIAMKMSKDYLNQLKDTFQLKKPEITITNETKTIAFFKCRKAIVSMMFKGEKKSYEVWFTRDIDNIDLGEYKVEGIDGFIMEMNMTDKGVTVHMLCTSIDQMNVPDSYFKVPDDYKIMTMEDMMNGKMKDLH